MSAVLSGFDIIELLLDEIPIAGVIGLADRYSTDVVSGYYNGRRWCRDRGIEYIEADKYNLSGKRDVENIGGLEIDVMLVVGWQRLIPGWLIDHVRTATLGLHGSGYGINDGRGRSPQTWALILRNPVFSLSLFRVDAGIDSGPVLGTAEYTLTERDDIRSSYAKACWTTASLLKRCLNKEVLESNGMPQSREGFYLPQRKPNDGEIDWRRPTNDIDAFVRALGRPYPGACVSLGNDYLKIWRSRPFEIDCSIQDSPEPGMVGQILSSQELIVHTGDGWLLIDEWDGPPGLKLRRGDVLPSSSWQDQMRTIVDRHRTKLPDCPLHSDILRESGMCESEDR